MKEAWQAILKGEAGWKARPAPALSGTNEVLGWGLSPIGQGLPLPLGMIPQIGRWLAITRRPDFTAEPVFGEGDLPFSADVLLLLWERREGGYGLLLPLLRPEGAVVLSGRPSELWAGMITGDADTPTTAPWFWLATGPDPLALAPTAVAQAAHVLGTFQPRTAKPAPAFANYLGWTTWEAFYHELSADKVFHALEGFSEAGVGLGFVLLKDGWLDTNGDGLRSFEAHPTRFPVGLRPVIERSREKYQVRYFGVWHLLAGYHAGLDPTGPLAKRFGTVAQQGIIRPWEGKSEALCLFEPAQGEAFFTAFYQMLRDAGVDFVQVDGQASLASFVPPGRPLGRTLLEIQRAQQSACRRHLTGDTIHGQGAGNEVAYALSETNTWRNSADCQPKQPLAAQQLHLLHNAFNAVWTSNFAWPDWDAFQTHGTAAELHAAARALSGGPVYVSDIPGQQNFRLLQRLALPDGTVPRFDQPGLPTPSSLFAPCHTQPVPLKLFNRRGPIAVVGLFHVQMGMPHPLQVSISPSEVPQLPHGPYAAYLYREGLLRNPVPGEGVKLRLAAGAYEIVTFSPIVDGVAVLGRLDLMGGAAAVRHIEEHRSGCWRGVILGGGKIGFHCASAPRSVRVHGFDIPFSYFGPTGLVTLRLAAATAVRVEVRL